MRRLKLMMGLWLPLSAQAATLTGTVVGVADGDTLTLLTPEKATVRVRLAEIDTPEAGQPYGKRAKQALSDWVFGKPVRLQVQSVDRYRRVVAHVFVGAVDVNQALVRQGAAWVYRAYTRDPCLWGLEAMAREAQRGLWALPETYRVPPWQWRALDAAERRERREAYAQAVQAPAFTCEGKRTCGEMGSCTEAFFYFEHCGVRRLDGNGSGVPCQALCQ